MYAFALLFCALIGLSFEQSLPTGIVFSLTECGRYPNYQQFKADNSSGKYTIFSLQHYPGTCIDDNYGKVGTQPWYAFNNYNNYIQFTPHSLQYIYIYIKDMGL